MKKVIMIALIALIALVALIASASAEEEWLPVSGTVYLPLKQDGAIVSSSYRLARGGQTSEREFKLPLGSNLKGAIKPFVGVMYTEKAMGFDYETMEGLSPVQVNGRIRADYVLPGEAPLEALQRHLSYTADVVKKNFKTTRVFKASVVKKSTLVFEGWLDMAESSLWELNPEEEGLTFKGAKVAPKKSKKPSTSTSTSTSTTPVTVTPDPVTEDTDWTIGGDTTTPDPDAPNPPSPSISWDIGTPVEDTNWTIGGSSSDSSSSTSAPSISWDIGGGSQSSSEDTGWTIGGSTSSDSSNSKSTPSISWDIGGGNQSSSEDTGFTIGGGESSNMEDTGFSI